MDTVGRGQSNRGLKGVGGGAGEGAESFGEGRRGLQARIFGDIFGKMKFRAGSLSKEHGTLLFPSISLFPTSI